MENKITQIYNRVSKDILKDYHRIKKQSVYENLSDIINYISKYIYILVIIFIILMLITFLTYSNAPIAILIRDNLSFYKTKDATLSIPSVRHQSDV